MPTDDHDDSTDTPRLIPAQPTAAYWHTMRRYWAATEDVEVFAKVGGPAAAFLYAGITSDGRYQVYVANMRYERIQLEADALDAVNNTTGTAQAATTADYWLADAKRVAAKMDVPFISPAPSATMEASGVQVLQVDDLDALVADLTDHLHQPKLPPPPATLQG